MHVIEACIFLKVRREQEEPELPKPKLGPNSVPHGPSKNLVGRLRGVDFRENRLFWYVFGGGGGVPRIARF